MEKKTEKEEGEKPHGKDEMNDDNEELLRNDEAAAAAAIVQDGESDELMKIQRMLDGLDSEDEDSEEGRAGDGEGKKDKTFSEMQKKEEELEVSEDDGEFDPSDVRNFFISNRTSSSPKSSDSASSSSTRREVSSNVSLLPSALDALTNATQTFKKYADAVSEDSSSANNSSSRKTMKDASGGRLGCVKYNHVPASSSLGSNGRPTKSVDGNSTETAAECLSRVGICVGLAQETWHVPLAGLVGKGGFKEEEDVKKREEGRRRRGEEKEEENMRNWNDGKKRGKEKITVKEKEKLKRSKGQSTHDSWKPEVWMQMRQQFD